MLVGTKSDLPTGRREVKLEDAQALAKQLDIPHIETR
jgi:hypothetical protein